MQPQLSNVFESPQNKKKNLIHVMSLIEKKNRKEPW